MQLFRISEIIVDDRHLSSLLRAMAGLVREATMPQPVIEKSVRVKNGKVGPADAMNIADLFVKDLVASGAKRIVVEDVRTFLTANGRDIGTAGYILQKAKQGGVLVRHGTGSGSYYEVRAPRGAKATSKRKTTKRRKATKRASASTSKES